MISVGTAGIGLVGHRLLAVGGGCLPNPLFFWRSPHDRFVRSGFVVRPGVCLFTTRPVLLAWSIRPERKVLTEAASECSKQADPLRDAAARPATPLERRP